VHGCLVLPRRRGRDSVAGASSIAILVLESPEFYVSDCYSSCTGRSKFHFLVRVSTHSVPCTASFDSEP